MMKHEIIKQLDEMEKKGIDRRRFLKFLAAAGLLVGAHSEARAFSSNAKGKIVIIGGGAAGISMAARLKRWLNEPNITLIDPSDRQFYQPGFTLIASGVYQPDDVWRKQEDCIPNGIKWIKDSVVAVDPVWNQVSTRENGKIPYDFLVLTPGLQCNWEKVEGITYQTLGEGNANCIYDFEGAQKTWKAMSEFAIKGGKGVYTDTYTKHKCGGAPKKICLLTEHYARKHGTRDKLQLDYFTAERQLYDVPYFTPRLEEIYKERNVPIHLNVRLKGVDTSAKKVYFERIETKGEEKIPYLLESAGTRKLLLLLSSLAPYLTRRSAWAILDEVDAGIFEYLFGELMRSLYQRGKGSLLFTSHDLRTLETLPHHHARFASLLAEGRFYEIKAGKGENLRDLYLRSLALRSKYPGEDIPAFMRRASRLGGDE